MVARGIGRENFPLKGKSMQLRLWWWREIRKANIPKNDRDLFERFGDVVIGGVLITGMQPAASELERLYSTAATRANATAWLTERGDYREQREQRLEFIEWMILIFVICGVAVDVMLLIHGK